MHWPRLHEEPLLYPLTRFLAQEGRALPEFEVLAANEVPEPYRTLLVHDGDMTSRLELFHEGKLFLDVLRHEQEDNAYRREVLLRVTGSGLPVEYGAIEIDLAQFEAPLRAKILEARQPLGGLLNEHGVGYRSEPRGFLRIVASSAMATLFDMPGTIDLYGRCNLLLSDRRTVLARIVEVLRPHSPT